MKKVLKLAIAVVMMMGLFVGTTMAQTTIAYVEADVLIQDMPEYKKANIDLETYAKQLEAQLKEEQTKFQKEYGAVKDSVDRGIITPIQQQQAQVRLGQKQERLEFMGRDAQNKLAIKEAELFKPINEKFQAALKAVATEKSYTYIVDKKMLLYFDGGVDATADVKAKLLQP